MSRPVLRISCVITGSISYLSVFKFTLWGPNVIITCKWQKKKNQKKKSDSPHKSYWKQRMQVRICIATVWGGIEQLGVPQKWKVADGKADKSVFSSLSRRNVWSGFERHAFVALACFGVSQPSSFSPVAWGGTPGSSELPGEQTVSAEMETALCALHNVNPRQV